MKETRKKIKDDLSILLKGNDISTKNKSKLEVNNLALNALSKSKTKIKKEIEVPKSVIEKDNKTFTCSCGVVVKIISDTKISIKKCSKCLRDEREKK